MTRPKTKKHLSLGPVLLGTAVKTDWYLVGNTWIEHVTPAV